MAVAVLVVNNMAAPFVVESVVYGPALVKLQIQRAGKTFFIEMTREEYRDFTTAFGIIGRKTGGEFSMPVTPSVLAEWHNQWNSIVEAELRKADLRN